MTRAALRKPQHGLFDAGPVAAARPQAQPPTVNEASVHPCAAPGCTAWGAFGVDVFRGVSGTWWCAEHRPAVQP